MSILYIRLPSKAAADAAEHWLSLPSQFALASQSGAVEKEGTLPLAELSGMVTAADRVVLLLAASDVSMLRVKTPPLSAAKLRLALPNLIEDQLMADPTECVVAPGDLVDGLRTAAVAQRSWLDILSQAFTTYGARSLAMVPAQASLPFDEGVVSAAVVEHGVDMDLTLRLSSQEAMGFPIFPHSADTAAAEVFDVARALAPTQPIHLYAPQARVPEFQAEGDRRSGNDESIKVFADNWPRIIAALGKNPLNLMLGMGADSGPQVNWRQWRWAGVLLGLILLVNAIGLNVEWFRMKRESKNLNDSMTQIYKSAYPNDTVIVDPLLQFQRKISEAERDSGKASPDDFTQLAGNFAEVLNNELRESKSHKTSATIIASIEYRDHGLLVHVKPDSQTVMDKLKFGLSARNLTLDSPTAGVWQIRSPK